MESAKKTSAVVYENIKRGMEFNINASLTAYQKGCIDKWVNDWHMSEELILHAHKITIANIGQCKFGYTDKILERWYKNHVTTVEQAEQQQKEFLSRRKNNKSDKESCSSPVGNCNNMPLVVAQFALAGTLYVNMYEIYGDNLSERLEEIIQANQNYAQCAGLSRKEKEGKTE